MLATVDMTIEVMLQTFYTVKIIMTIEVSSPWIWSTPMLIALYWFQLCVVNLMLA